MAGTMAASRLPAPKFIVAGLLIVGAVSYLMFSGINDTMVYYYTLSELMEKKSDLAGLGVRVHGHVSSGTIRIDRERSQVDFLVMEKKTPNTLPVTYQGIIPDTFKDGAEVVVEGTYQADRHHFQATILMAKCPSKYEEAQTASSEKSQVPDRPY
jgi:cytochrome c-type biogenesis protein CcmE